MMTHDDDSQVLITSYEDIKQDLLVFKRIPWRYLVVDEAHRLKNKDSALAAELRQLDVEGRLGTRVRLVGGECLFLRLLSGLWADDELPRRVQPVEGRLGRRVRLVRGA